MSYAQKPLLFDVPYACTPLHALANDPRYEAHVAVIVDCAVLHKATNCVVVAVVLDITTAWTPENVVCAFARNADIGAETTVKDAANFAIAAVAIEADVPIVAAPARNAAIADTASKSAVEAPVAPVVTRIKPALVAISAADNAAPDAAPAAAAAANGAIAAATGANASASFPMLVIIPDDDSRRELIPSAPVAALAAIIGRRRKCKRTETNRSGRRTSPSRYRSRRKCNHSRRKRQNCRRSSD